jgi:hypothetical protein
VTNQTTAQTGPTTAASQPELPLSVTELTTLLQMVNQLFPLPERPAKLSTREGRAYKQTVAQREAYIKALQAAISHATAKNRLRQELDLAGESNETERNSYLEQIKNLLRYLEQTGPFMLVAFQLGLVIQRRPEIVVPLKSYGHAHVVDFNLGDLKVGVFGEEQLIQLTAPGMSQQTFAFDDQGNLLDGDFDRLIGYLTRAGYVIDPANAKKALSTKARGDAYTDTKSKLDAMMRSVGRTAMKGSGLGWDFEPSLSMDAPAPDLGMHGFDVDSLFGQKSKGGRLPGYETDFIVIITDGIGNPPKR